MTYNHSITLYWIINMKQLVVSLTTVFLFVFTSAQAETYSMDQITHSLQNVQNEYQSQLDRKPRRASKPKRQTKHSTNKISRQAIERILQKPTTKRTPQARQQPRQVQRKPVARAHLYK